MKGQACLKAVFTLLFITSDHAIPCLLGVKKAVFLFKNPKRFVGKHTTYPLQHHTCVPPTVLTLTTMTILWVNSHSPERKNQQLWLDKLKQQGLEFIETGTHAMCHKFTVAIDCDGSTAAIANSVLNIPFSQESGVRQQECICLYLDISSFWPCTLWPLRSRDMDCQRGTGTGGPAVCGFPVLSWTHRFYQNVSRGPTHPTHPPRSALKWEIQGMVRNFTVSLVHVASKVSSTRLFAKRDKTMPETPTYSTTASSVRRLTLSCALHDFVVGLVVLWTDMVAPPAELVQARPATRTCLTVHTGLTVFRALCKDKHIGVSVYMVAKYNLTASCGNYLVLSFGMKLLVTYWEHIPFVCHCGPALQGSSPGICPDEGRILLGIVCRSFCWSRSRNLTCTLDKETWAHRQSLFKPHKLSSVSSVLNIHCVILVHVSLEYSEELRPQHSDWCPTQWHLGF